MIKRRVDPPYIFFLYRSSPTQNLETTGFIPTQNLTLYAAISGREETTFHPVGF
jgi:hypothetical protein